MSRDEDIFDLYIKDSTVSPAPVRKTMDDSIAEFATGQAVFFQDGVWAYNQIKGQSVSDTIWECSPSTLAPRAKRTRV